MNFEVEMLAFGKPGEIRIVNVPQNRFCEDLSDGVTVEEALEIIFRHGQNEVQPKPHPSVSVGDVIRFRGERFRVEPIGFQKI